MGRVLWGLLPLLAFYLLESGYGLRAAVLGAMAIAAVDLAVGRWRDGRWSRLTLGSTALVVGLGGLSLLSDDERFVLWTPVLGDLVLAAVLVGGLALPESLLEVALREQDPGAPPDPELRGLVRALTLRLAVVLVAHAGLAAWSVGQARETWLFVTGPGQLLLFAAWVGLEVAGARFSGR